MKLPRIEPGSTRTLAVFAAALLFIGWASPNPALDLFLAVLAALSSGVGALFGAGRARAAAALLLLLSAFLAAAGWSGYERHMSRYLERARSRSAPAAPPALHGPRSSAEGAPAPGAER